MASYTTNKGIGKETEFKGFQAHYIYYLAAVCLGSFMLFIILYFIGIPAIIGVIIVILSFFLTTVYLYRLNKKYGLYGLAQKRAKAKRPHYIKAGISCFKNITTNRAASEAR
jgi:hypothetical protein